MSTAARPLAGAVIAFDLDGTLVDTAPDIAVALNAVLHEQRLPALPFAQARLLVGRGARVLIEQGFAAAGAPLQTADTPPLVERFVEIYRTRIADLSRPFDGCVEALDSLASAGAVLTVCTNKRTALSIALLDALDLTRHFTAVIGADSAPAPKPDPRHLLTAIEAAGGFPDRALMVGDSAADVGAARGAGVPSIMVTFGYTEIPVDELGGDYLIEGFGELAPLAGRLLAAGR